MKESLKKRIFLIVAARPNFMKIAPLYHALSMEDWVDSKIIHTGQHYDHNMSDTFFCDFLLPEPYINLGVGSGSHAEQTGKVMIEFEKIASRERPDLTIVVGDVNSTMACAIVAAKLGLKVAHLEAGLRSFDRSMPEEINRIVTDTVVDILWTPSPDADVNLLNEGIAPEKIQRVGNIMIDSLEMLRTKIESGDAYKQLSLIPGGYGVVTLHRPSNVDEKSKLKEIILVLQRISQETPLIFPVHPRTRNNIDNLNLNVQNSNLQLVEPLSYLSFMNLIFNSKFVLTDSGGIQEETSYLRIPCLTLRENTERPITVTQGTNQLVGLSDLELCVKDIKNGLWKKGSSIEFWDGNTSARIVAFLKKTLVK